jgi:hypothetical protein
MESPYAKKYLELVSKPSTCKFTEDHHIVPVAYFVDVMGISDVRRPGSLDMAKENIVTLSKGRHLLAHYYLVRCAQKCIRSQMVNAFRRMYNDRDKWDDKEVLKKSKEIDRFYRSLKGKKIPHKDGTEEVSRDNLVSTRQWKDGANVGLELKRRPNGKFVEITDHDMGLKIRVEKGNTLWIECFGPSVEKNNPWVYFCIGGTSFFDEEIGMGLCEGHGKNKWGFRDWGTNYMISASYSRSVHYVGTWCASTEVPGPGYTIHVTHGNKYTPVRKKPICAAPAYHRLATSCVEICKKVIPLMDFGKETNPEYYIKFLEAPEVRGALEMVSKAEPFDIDGILARIPA